MFDLCNWCMGKRQMMMGMVGAIKYYNKSIEKHGWQVCPARSVSAVEEE